MANYELVLSRESVMAILSMYPPENVDHSKCNDGNIRCVAGQSVMRSAVKAMLTR